MQLGCLEATKPRCHEKRWIGRWLVLLPGVRGGGGVGSVHNREDNDTGDDESFRPLCFVQVQVGSVVLSTANGMMTRIGHST